MNIWYKELNYQVRKIDRREGEMYQNLLHLSLKRKKIKDGRHQASLDTTYRRSWSRSKRRVRRNGNHRVSQLSIKNNSGVNIPVIGKEINFKEDKEEDDEAKKDPIDVVSGENPKRIKLPPITIPCSVEVDSSSAGLSYDDVDKDITRSKRSKLKSNKFEFLPKIVVPEFSPAATTPRYDEVFDDQIENQNLKVRSSPADQNKSAPNKLNVKRRRSKNRNLSDISSIEVCEQS